LQIFTAKIILPTALLAGATKAEAAATRRESRKNDFMAIRVLL